MVAMALTTQLIGINMLLGAFVAGILIGESPILTRHIDEQLRGLVVALFMPVFFGLSGLSADLTVLRNADLAMLAVGLILIASVGKFLGAFVGGQLGGLSRAELLALGCAMNARGSTEVIVASIGLSMGVLSQNLFTLIVTMAVVTTTAMPTTLRWALKRLPLRKKERVRLEREELDAKGFVSNLERLLLVADDSANGKFAGLLARAIAGFGGKPITLLDMSAGDRSSKPEKPKGEISEERVATPKAGAEESKEEFGTAAKGTMELKAQPDKEKSANVDVTRRQQESNSAEAVAGEARKGYDFLIVGIAKARNPKGGFSKDVSLITKGFEGPLAVVDSPELRRDLSERHGKILVPVTGTEVSRRAAEIALVLARASDAQITALYVTRATAAGYKRKGASRKHATRRHEQATLKDISGLADRYEVKLRSTTRVNMAPDEAILREAKRGYDLIVLGVSRRPGDTLFFGDTAASVLDRSGTSSLFVAS